MTEDAAPHELVTVGGSELPEDLLGRELYVGPLDDPDRYELLNDGILGGEGRTWRASYHGGLNNPLVEAVKMLFPPEGSGANWPSDRDLRRWQDNAALLRHLAQSHVVQLHDIFGGDAPHAKGTLAGGRTFAYLTMEWVEGPTLAEKLRGKPVTVATLPERLQYITDVATAVASLHSHTRSAGNPVLHRDLTPANCIVHATRGIVLIDISGMRLVDDGFDPLGRHTPAYAAPEVLRAPHEPRHPSSDLYAVAAVAIFVLTGQDPDAEPNRRLDLTMQIWELLQRAGAGSAEAAARHLLVLFQPDPSARPPDVLSWSRRLTALAAQPEVTGSNDDPSDTADVSGPVGDSTPRARSDIRRRRTLLMGSAAVVVATGIGAVLLAQHNQIAGRRATSVSRARPTTTPTPQNIDFPLLPGRARTLVASKGLSTVDFATAFGQFTTPARGASVKSCAYFTGTSHLPAGQTIMLSMHDVGINNDFRFLQVVFGYKLPNTLTAWSGAQYFNDQALGHEIHIELIEMPLDAALLKANADDDLSALDQLASKGKVIAATTVTRVKGVGPKSGTCPPPAGIKGD